MSTWGPLPPSLSYYGTYVAYYFGGNNLVSSQGGTASPLNVFRYDGGDWNVRYGGGEVILLGRGAGCILPAASTLHVRVVAALTDRIAYMAQWLRLTMDEAAQQVELRDSRPHPHTRH